MSDLNNKYNDFVNGLLSNESVDFDSFISRLVELKNAKCQINTLLTGAVGMSAESGEFMEIVKKVIFQGKPWDEANQIHLKKELSDIMFYVMSSCIGLGISLDDVIQTNIDKLEARYPGGKFDAHYSENRKKGDL